MLIIIIVIIKIIYIIVTEELWLDNSYTKTPITVEKASLLD